jgi:hypothetical protein
MDSERWVKRSSTGEPKMFQTETPGGCSASSIDSLAKEPSEKSLSFSSQIIDRALIL